MIDYCIVFTETKSIGVVARLQTYFIEFPTILMDSLNTITLAGSDLKQHSCHNTTLIYVYTTCIMELYIYN